MYSLLSPIRYVINPRFNLTTPIQSGLFYIAPGCGYFFGTFFGGRWADRTVKRWIKKRNGERVPEDRLRSCLPFLGGVIPGCILIYGWSIEKEVGGVPLPVIVMFLQGMAQLFCFPRYILLSISPTTTTSTFSSIFAHLLPPTSHLLSPTPLTTPSSSQSKHLLPRRDAKALLRSRRRQLSPPLPLRLCRHRRVLARHRSHRRRLVQHDQLGVSCCLCCADVGGHDLGKRMAGDGGEET